MAAAARGSIFGRGASFSVAMRRRFAATVAEPVVEPAVNFACDGAAMRPALAGAARHDRDREFRVVDGRVRCEQASHEPCPMHVPVLPATVCVGSFAPRAVPVAHRTDHAGHESLQVLVGDVDLTPDLGLEVDVLLRRERQVRNEDRATVAIVEAMFASCSGVVSMSSRAKTCG